MKEIDPSGIAANVLTSPIPIQEDNSVDTPRAVAEATETELQREKEGEKAQDKQTLIEDVKKNLDKLNDFIPVTSTNLSFEFDENGDPPFIRVIDTDNDEVIREIPSQEFREVAKALEEFADKVSGKGLLFDKTA